jgi:hypothetical protein
MRIDPDECRDPDLLAAEVRRLRAVIAAGEPTLTDEEREAVLHFSGEYAGLYGKSLHGLALRLGLYDLPRISHQPCQGSLQKNFTLTDEEREAIREGADALYGGAYDAEAAILRELLERLHN